VAEPILSLAVNGREQQMSSKLVSFGVPRRAVRYGDGNRSELSSVAIMGLGYVGLPTAAALHGECARIIGIDVSEQRLAEIAALEADLGEPDRMRLKEALAEGTLELTNDQSAVAAADAVIICVPTPVDAEQTPDLAALRGACASVVSHARPGQVIILTSTTYVGTTSELLTVPLAERGSTLGTRITCSGRRPVWSAAPPRRAPGGPPR
jgi:UDP-N-acetyl-D-glucosamine dehydrogenase